VAPDRNEENLLYQTLIGAWPLRENELPRFRKRLEAYMIKANREAMVHTRWTRPNAAHERAVTGFLKTILKPAKSNRFLNDFLPFQKKIAEYGMLNGLAQVLIKMTSPGVPDFYQGCDLWDLRLVDPDNRGAIDFNHREKMLAEIEKRSSDDPAGYCRELVDNWRDGRIKLYLIWKILNIRRDQSRLFSEGEFGRVEIAGKRDGNVLAFLRRREHDWIVVVAPRWLARAKAPLGPLRMEAFWSGSQIALPENAPLSWLNVLTGETLGANRGQKMSKLPLSDIFRDFPVAVLAGSSVIS
jgi:(1->4)-alpha-D-glucan 1-alpha-D-glucosylmutase